MTSSAIVAVRLNSVIDVCETAEVLQIGAACWMIICNYLCGTHASEVVICLSKCKMQLIPTAPLSSVAAPTSACKLRERIY